MSRTGMGRGATVLELFAGRVGQKCGRIAVRSEVRERMELGLRGRVSSFTMSYYRAMLQDQPTVTGVPVCLRGGCVTSWGGRSGRDRAAILHGCA